MQTVAKVCPEAIVRELARAAGLDRLHGIGPTVRMVSDWLAIRPVHELLALFRSSR